MTVELARLDLPEYALYYPAAYWRTGKTSDWIKTLLLFFDGVATLVTDSGDEARRADPIVAGHLEEVGLLKMLDTNEALQPWRHDREIGSRIVSYVEAARSTMDLRGRREGVPHVLNMSKIPFQLRGYLREDGLAEPWVREHHQYEALRVPRDVWRVVLTALASHLAEFDPHGLNIKLLPVTDEADCVGFVNSHMRASRASVVADDLGTINIDLSSVPIDEVIGFREEHGSKFRAYRRGLNAYVRQLSQASVVDQLEMRRDRIEEMRDFQSDIVRETRPLRQAWSLTPFVLGMVGAGLEYRGDHTGAVGAAIGAVASVFAVGATKQPQAEFTYLFQARRHFEGRNRR